MSDAEKDSTSAVVKIAYEKAVDRIVEQVAADPQALRALAMEMMDVSIACEAAGCPTSMPCSLFVQSMASAVRELAKLAGSGMGSILAPRPVTLN